MIKILKNILYSVTLKEIAEITRLCYISAHSMKDMSRGHIFQLFRIIQTSALYYLSINFLKYHWKKLKIFGFVIDTKMLLVLYEDGLNFQNFPYNKLIHPLVNIKLPWKKRKETFKWIMVDDVMVIP